MQQYELDRYYSIDFEHEFSVNYLKDLLIKNFPTSNIFIININIESEEETIEHVYDPENKQFYIVMSVRHLKTDGVDDFEDVKTGVLLKIYNELQVSPYDVMDFLQEFSKKVHSKIYVRMEDVANILFSLSDYSYWCIDNDKRKIVFDAEEFFDNPKNMYQDYIPF